jgi:tRNA (guanine9-N1)-methyltransferase
MRWLQGTANTPTFRVSRCEICSLCGEALEQTKKQFPQHTSWAVEQHADSWDKCFEGQMKSIVYLTADSPEEILTLDKDCVYIVGGIVDRNRYPQLCLQKAGTHGVRTARLPIDAHLKLTGSKVRSSGPVYSMRAHAAVLCFVQWRWPQGAQQI